MSLAHADTDPLRRRMVHAQLVQRGIADLRVLEALGRVPRECFLASADRDLAYADRALAIECGQTISQPYIVALMTEALELEHTTRVLEIGTGSGYQTAVLAELASHVVTIERHGELSRCASRVLGELGYRNIDFIVGDGSRGWPEQAPYERILVTAAAPRVPPALIEQLAEGGLLVLPVGGDEVQDLQVIRKRGDKLHVRSLTACRFVRLVGESTASDSPPA